MKLIIAKTLFTILLVVFGIAVAMVIYFVTVCTVLHLHYGVGVKAAPYMMIFATLMSFPSNGPLFDLHIFLGVLVGLISSALRIWRKRRVQYGALPTVLVFTLVSTIVAVSIIGEVSPRPFGELLEKTKNNTSEFRFFSAPELSRNIRLATCLNFLVYATSLLLLSRRDESKKNIGGS